MELNCSGMRNMTNGSNCTDAVPHPDIVRGASLTAIWVVAVVGNILTLAIVLGYKLKKVPDLLVFGLACTDLVACAFPIPVSLWSYYSGWQIDGTEDLVRLCSAYNLVAKFTRDSSVFIVTLMVVDRFVWVLRPIQYHQGQYYKFFCISLPATWLLAIFLSLLSLIPGVDIQADGNICLFGFQNWYGILVVVYGIVQFIVVLVCFVIVIVEVVKLARRRQKVLMKGKKSACHGSSFNALNKSNLNALAVEQDKLENGHHSPQSESPVESDMPRLSCLKWAKKLLKCISEKVHPSAEQQFAVMFSAIIVLFYISWLPIVVSTTPCS